MAEPDSASPAAGGLRAELARALGLGELIVLAALVVLAPVMRLENAYVAAISFSPQDIVGEGYFLWLVAILGLLVAARTVAAGRLALPEPWTAAVLGCWTLFLALRGGASDHPLEAGQLLAAWFSHLALFIIVLAASAGKDHARRLLIAAILAGLAVESLRAVGQVHAGLPEMRRELLSGGRPAGADMSGPVALSRVMSNQPFNTFLNPNTLAAWLAMAALAGTGLLAGFLTAEFLRGRERSPGRLAALAVTGLPTLLLAGWALRLTGSKGAFLAAFSAVAGTMLMLPPASRERTRHRLRLAGGAVLALALAAAFAYWIKPDLPGRSGLAASLEVRAGYWRAAAIMVEEHPMRGTGPGTFGAHYPEFKGPLDEESQSAHCAWIETAAECGLPGLALLAGFWALVLWRLWRRPAAAPAPPGSGEASRQAFLILLAGAGAMLVFGWLKFAQEDIEQFSQALAESPTAGPKLAAFLSIRALGFPLIWAAAFALSAWPLAIRRGEDGAPEVHERWLVWGAAAAVAAFLLHASVDMDMGMRSMVGSALLLSALALSGPGRRELRLEGRWMAAGATLLVLLAVGTFRGGLREYSRGAVLAALTDAPPKEIAEKPFERAAWSADRLGDAVAVDPQNYHLHLQLANVCNLARNLAPGPEPARQFRARAEAEIRRAVELAPARTTPRKLLARWLLLDGRPADAAAAFEQTVRLYPLKAEFRLGWGDAELLAGRPRAARARYREALATSRTVGDEAIHLSVLFEAPAQMRWQEPQLEALAGALDQAIKDEPGDGALLLRRALVELARGQPRPALEWLGRAAGAEPHDAQLALFEGYGLRLVGETQKALEKMRQAGEIEKEPGALSAGPYAVATALARTRDALRMQSAQETKQP